VQAVREGGDEGPRHEWSKASLVEGLGRGQGHGSHCTPMEGTLHTICARSEQQSMLSTTEDTVAVQLMRKVMSTAGTSDRYQCFQGSGLVCMH